MEVIKNSINFYSFDKDNEFVGLIELDFGNSLVRFTDGYVFGEIDRRIYTDDDGNDLGNTTLFQNAFVGEKFRGKIYVPFSAIQYLGDVQAIQKRKFINDKQEEIEMLYMYSSDPLKYIIVDKFHQGELQEGLEELGNAIKQVDLFGNERNPVLRYSEAKIRFDKMLKMIGKGEYTIDEKLTTAKGFLESAEVRIAVKTCVD